jgi:hypothetical protein
MNTGDTLGMTFTAEQAHTRYNKPGGDRHNYVNQAAEVIRKRKNPAAYHKSWRFRWLNPVTGQEEEYDRMEDPRESKEGK